MFTYIRSFAKHSLGKTASIALLVTYLIGATACTAHAAGTSALEAKLKSSGTQFTAEIVNLSTGEKLLQYNANIPLNPASSIKLFTAYTALRKLGTNYTFKTGVTVKPNGDVCVKGGGDPSFVMEDLYLLVEHLKRRGVEWYSGRITLDASVFDEEFYPEDRSDQNSERAYNAPISGLNFNYNTISVFVNPRARGQSAIIGLDYPFDFVKVEGKVMTSSSGTDVTWDKKGKGDLEIVSLGGKIAEGSDEWRKPFRIRNPAKAFGEAMAKQLKASGILPHGNVSVKSGICSDTGGVSFNYESKPLSYVIQLMDKYSNNFIADSLIKTLDHEVNHKQGSAEGGLKIVRAEMKSVGIDLTANGRSFVSGSGLTLGNRAAASDFVSLIKQIYQEKLYLPEVFTSLPIAALDGTLRRKYGSTPAAYRLRAKTGTLDNVQSLVGIYPNSEGQWLAVAVVANGSHPIPEKELGEFLGAH
jgi:D-alanyl-D-alanine carboxypeptidase/D-alanyl-D-alanine-endopeptidase (penicillin-binding protein 4)